MKKLITLMILILCVATLFAQAPEKFSYQAVVRNTTNQLVTNAPVGVRVSILQGSADGTALYVEIHSAVTNANGLLTVEIGGGTVQQGVFADIDWANGPFFLKTETDPAGGSNYTVTSTQQLLSVPYALYAKEAGNVPQTVGELTNDANYITAADIAGLLNTVNELNRKVDSLEDVVANMSEPPVLETVSVSDVGIFKATFHGNITSEGFYSVTKRGFCYGTSENPTVDGNFTSDGTGEGAFSHAVITLQANTTYYVRAYVTNSIGTTYGNQLSFTTKNIPTVTTAEISDITYTSATCGGEIVADEGITVSARGVCWEISPNPTISNAHTNDGNGMGVFTSSLTGLNHNTTYYIRAYITTNEGTFYGNELSFTTILIPDGQPCPGTPTVTDQEGNVYNTVHFGNQCWMKENLRSTKAADGSAIPKGGSTTSNTEPYYYDYSSHSLPLATRGYLYNWPAAQLVCPSGWHLPSDAEWTQLTDYVSSQSEYTCSGNSNNIAKALASTEGWNPSTNNCVVGNDPNSNNATGFSAVPAGACGGSSFYDAFYYADFWSSTLSFSYYAYYRELSYNLTYVRRNDYSKSNGYSVRCLRD